MGNVYWAQIDMRVDKIEYITEYSLGSSNDSYYTATLYFSYTILANPKVGPHASNTYQSKTGSQ